MATQAEDVYATLLLSDSYLPGALVLAHSLRDAGTKKKLVVLTTNDTMTADAMSELRELYDYIIPVDQIINKSPANLYLMNRPDLGATFTKIQLWKQTQFRKIVYVDADMVALRAPDELFALEHAFSAAPDIGWPDLFNSGLLVLSPNLGDYYALLAMAQRGISFDGADQGLLNMHFKNTYNRLSFTYNVTPSGHYQYVPAYRHFQSSISLVHFIGSQKPWAQGREASSGSGPYDELLGRWWAVYDRHYRSSSSEHNWGVPKIVRQYVKGEDVLKYNISEAPHQPQRENPEISIQAPQITDTTKIEAREAEAKPTPVKQEISEYSSWDPTKTPPPANSKGEASNLPTTRYTMSKDTTPFKAPANYPKPPSNLHYEVPKTPTYQKPNPIFPWEKSASVATRVFPEDEEPKGSGPSKVGEQKQPSVEPPTQTLQVTSTNPWQSFQRGNAWDDVPEIERYIGHLQKNRKGNIQVLQGYGSGIEQISSPGGLGASMRLTDFPTELERPSLPVTPAPMRRPTFWGSERDEEGQLPAAEGVPSQADWNPLVQLEMLARRQSDVLSHKLNTETREIPNRPLPFGSEMVKSPTQSEKPAPPAQSELSRKSEIEQPSFSGPGATWEKDEGLPASTPHFGASEEEKDILET